MHLWTVSNAATWPGISGTDEETSAMIKPHHTVQFGYRLSYFCSPTLSSIRNNILECGEVKVVVPRISGINWQTYTDWGRDSSALNRKVAVRMDYINKKMSIPKWYGRHFHWNMCFGLNDFAQTKAPYARTHNLQFIYEMCHKHSVTLDLLTSRYWMHSTDG